MKQKVKSLAFGILFILMLIGTLFLIWIPVRKVLEQTRKTNTPVESPYNKPLELSQDINEVIKSGKPIKCIITNKTMKDLVGGILYSYKGEYRTELVIKKYDTLSKTFSIIKGNSTYLWTGEGTTGMILDSPNKDALTQEQDESYKKIQLETLANSVTFECLTWKAEESLFEPPAQIKFVDLTMVLKKMEIDARADCKRCEKEATKTQIAECKKVLNCNRLDTMQSTDSNNN